MITRSRKRTPIPLENSYAERDIGTRINSLLGMLKDIDVDEIEDNLRKQLEELVTRLEDILRGEQ